MVYTEDINNLIIPTITVGRQQQMVGVQLWLWVQRAKLAVQGQFQSLMIHCKRPKKSRISRQIIVLKCQEYVEVFSQLKEIEYL